MAIQEAGQSQGHQSNENHGISRRRFLIGGGAIVGTAALAAVGFSELGRDKSSKGLVVPGVASDGTGSEGDNNSIQSATSPTNTPEATATAEPTVTPEREPNTLREFLDATGQTLGVEYPSYHILGQEKRLTPEYTAIPSTYFNMLVSPNFDWTYPDDPHPVHGALYLYDFTLPDAAVNFAKKNKMQLQGTHLLWGSKTIRPEWLDRGNFSNAQLQDIMNDHLDNVVGRYSKDGVVTEYSVINELEGQPWEAGNAFWYDHFGKDFVGPALTRVRNIDKNAKTLISDFGIEIPGTVNYLPDRAERLYQLVGDLKKAGVPLDGISFHMHLWLKDFVVAGRIDQLASAFAKNVKKWQDLGVYVNVGEFDLRTDGVAGTQAEQFALQGKVAAAMHQAALDAKVNNFALWGVSDRFGQTYKDARPFDANDQPKPLILAIEANVHAAYKKSKAEKNP